MKVVRLALFSDDNGWQCVLKYGFRGKIIDLDLEKDLFPVREVTEISPDGESWRKLFNFIVPVYHKKKPVAYLLIGDINSDPEELMTNDLPFIQTLTNIIAVAIENKKLAKENIRQEGIRKELELAARMQSMLFPDASSLPHNEKIDIAVYYQPHYQVGGDYYDYIPISEEEVIFCMADVSGKGVTAALLMSNFQANLRAISDYTSSLKEIVLNLNRKVFQSAQGEMFITFFVAKYNIPKREFSYINAGHPPPVLLPDGQSGENGKESFEWLKVGCMGLGMLHEIPQVNETTLRITPGSTVICYTDGVIELENNSQQPYGIDRLVTLLVKNRTLSIDVMISKISRELEIFKGRQPYLDDIALLSCRFN